MELLTLGDENMDGRAVEGVVVELVTRLYAVLNAPFDVGVFEVFAVEVEVDVDVDVFEMLVEVVVVVSVFVTCFITLFITGAVEYALSRIAADPVGFGAGISVVVIVVAAFGVSITFGSDGRLNSSSSDRSKSASS